MPQPWLRPAAPLAPDGRVEAAGTPQFGWPARAISTAGLKRALIALILLKRGVLMNWILILHFTCAVGYGGPASVTLPCVYVTEQECTEDGNMWLSRNANPTRAVASFDCNYVTRTKVFYFHNEEHQE
jgi:hypothetical protein